MASITNIEIQEWSSTALVDDEAHRSAWYSRNVVIASGANGVFFPLRVLGYALLAKSVKFRRIL